MLWPKNGKAFLTCGTTTILTKREQNASDFPAEKMAGHFEYVPQTSI